MKNPYLTALTVITIVTGLIAAGLYCVALVVVGRAGQEPGNAGFAQIVAANGWLTFCGFALLATLVVGGIAWRSPAAKFRDEQLNRLVLAPTPNNAAKPTDEN